MYNFYIDFENYWKLLVINLSWIIISWFHPYMHYIGLPTSSYLPVVLESLTFPQGTGKTRMNTKIKPMLITSMKLDGYSSKLPIILIIHKFVC